MHFFTETLISWYAQAGRKDLPWQRQPTAYRIWVSEIMLQQTQVNTVIPYYQAFMQEFPTVTVLAQAELNTVLHYWSGLGYYARARHLHQAAQIITQNYQGELPVNLEDLMQLPGIGRSTAGAILALAYGEPYPILDGNVKRVLCRYHAIDGWPGENATLKQLWQWAETYTPTTEVKIYTQAIMDFGATVCTRARPACVTCPLSRDCQAFQTGQPTFYPRPKPRKPLPVKTAYFFILQHPQGQVLLQQRPAEGLWGGLWSFPQAATSQNLTQWCEQHLAKILPFQRWPPFRHTFTHFHLDIEPIYIVLDKQAAGQLNLNNTLWYDANQPPQCGLAAPVTKLLAILFPTTTGDRLL